MIAAVTVGLLLAGCGSSGGDKPEPSGKPSKESPAAAAPKKTKKLSTEWIPKIDAATGSGTQGVCATVGMDRCAQHLTRIAEVVIDLEVAIDSADARARYPRSVKDIDKVSAASNGYATDGCLGDPSADLDGSPCFKYSADIMVGASSLTLDLGTDELRTELGG
ncbi:hypothetical protein [Streptomyces malaysiensis]|uniref:Uncharacterized protein n=1 Tax=Streptomyces malaysiensis subsp. samsunensis TaxID=459658 RepID=A0A9X2LYF0_STRMQ|nr:hypothetical protein [Streptomyces samsunensis]MCQ8831773.1 hypothetical protein [Streptomyces samsunensis]